MYLIQDHLKFPEWITTIAFYKAVQLVEAVCVFRRGRGCSGHDERSRVIQLAPFNQTKLFLHHKSLRNESEVARYLYDRESKKGYSSFSDRIPAGEVVDRIIRRCLVPLEEIVVACLANKPRQNCGGFMFRAFPRTFRDPPSLILNTALCDKRAWRAARILAMHSPYKRA
jgi:hypothetical protein